MTPELFIRYTERVPKTRPDILYKYVDLTTAWESLQGSTLAFTPASRFNDPFDANPVIDMDLRDEEFESLWEKSSSAKAMSLQEFIRRMRTNIPVAEAELKRHVDSMNNLTFGAVCFTAHPNAPLMWAHYAGRHKGMIIGYDSNYGEMKKTSPVAYQTNRHALRLGEAFDGTYLRIKNKVWEPEDEWRLIARLDACEVKMRGEAPIFVYPVGKEAVVCIKFGCRTPGDFKVALANSIKKWGYLRCQMIEVMQCEKTYELREEPYLLPLERAALDAQGLHGESLGAE